MIRRYSSTMRIIGIASLIVFLSTQIVFADGTVYSTIRSQQPENTQAVGTEIANVLGGEFKVQAPASGSVGVFLYKASPFLFAGTLIKQLTFGSGSPTEIRIAGLGLAVLGFVIGKFVVHKILKKPLSARRLWAWIAASVYTFVNTGIAVRYVAMGQDMLHDCRKAASQMLWLDRDYGRRKGKVRLSVRPQKVLETGIVVQAAVVYIEGRLGNYEDDINSVGIDQNTFVVSLVTADPGDSLSVEKLAGRGKAAMINGGYYHRDEGGRCFPTGLVIKDGKIVSSFQQPGNRGSLQAILASTGKKVMIVPSSYFQDKRYPFDGKTQIVFALQAGPLPVFNGQFNELAEHFHGDGRSLSAIYIDDRDGIYFMASEGGDLFNSGVMFLINRFFKGLVGPDYGNTARFADDALRQRGRKLVSFMYVDGGGSSFLGVKDKGRIVRSGPGYHPVVNAVVAVPRIEADPVNYLLSLTRSDTSEGIQKAIDGIDRLSRSVDKSPEEFQKILSDVSSADPDGVRSVFTSMTRDQLADLIARHSFAGRMLAELVPYKALGVFGINRRLSVEVLAENINRVSGMPVRNLVERELILALRRYAPEEKFALLNGLDQTTWQWLGRLDAIIRGYPELMRLFRDNIPAAIEVVDDSADERCVGFVSNLITRYSRTADGINLKFIFDFMEGLCSSNVRQQREAFGDIARWLLLCDIDISQPFLEAYFDVYGDEGAGFLITAGLPEDTSIKALRNLREIAKRSEKLAPTINSVLNEQLSDSPEARAAGAAILELCL